MINNLKKYFDIYELVSRRVYNTYGDRAWRFFDPRLLETLLFIRKGLDKPITINNYIDGGNFEQRGLRDNLTPIVSNKTLNKKLYLSAHTRGMAIDFDVKGMEAEEVRNWLLSMSDRLPYKIRLEHRYDGDIINWVHLDVDHEEDNPKVYLFDV
jgi:hypothetical protein